jgi:hypothetical protein
MKTRDPNATSDVPADARRRELLGAAPLAALAALASGAVAATAGAANPAGATPAPAPASAGSASAWRALRRVVVSETPDGKPLVIADGAPANAFELNGTRITRLWEAGDVPVALPLAADAGATAGNGYRPGFAGTSFYVAELPPGSGPSRIPLHRNDTLDYMAILAGEVDLVLEDRAIPLRTGDTLVLGGANHTWANRGTTGCLLLFVVVTGAR